MKAERSTLEQVKARFEFNKKKMEEKQEEYDLEERMRELKKKKYGSKNIDKPESKKRKKLK